MEQILPLDVYVKDTENMGAQRTANVPPTQELTDEAFCL